jgi:hypothetical protein
MGTILTSIYCIPCVWSLVAILGTFGVCSYIMNAWVPFRGPLPSDGPVEGFPSKNARIDFFNTQPQRIRASFKAGVIGGVLWLTGLLTAIIILSKVGAA